MGEFGKAQVFKDVDSIPLGRDFRGHLNDVVGDCGVMLAIVGPHWTEARNPAGQRRLEDLRAEVYLIGARFLNSKT